MFGSLREWEIIRVGRADPATSTVRRLDRTSAMTWLRGFKGDYSAMQKLRAILADTHQPDFRLSDDEAIAALSQRFESGVLAVRRIEKRETTPDISGDRFMSGYITLLKFVIYAESADHLDDLVGFRKGRLAKGFSLYRLLRVPETSEFEVSGTSITPKHVWDEGPAKERAAALDATAAYHRNTAVPTFDEIQKRNARASMGISGLNTLVKIIPVDFQPIDEGNAGYPPGHGIPQWRLTDAVRLNKSLPGKLIVQVKAGAPMPWKEDSSWVAKVLASLQPA